MNNIFNVKIMILLHPLLLMLLHATIPIPGANSKSSSNTGSQQRYNSKPQVICQHCDKPGHVVTQCRKLKNAFPWISTSGATASSNSSATGIPKPVANVANTTAFGDSNWLLDSGASHHITSDLNNLSLHLDYVGDDVMIGDGLSDTGASGNGKA
ncbi:hypothetical protein A4A49_20549 [Nicotiana attenuata]|uniref:CCHC-type domain-containing protein n=1 Tax=Nicotiana attenuata TaxID=49451 RepID=A0A1J6IJ83_NICAT|nr:hypothetical protein A4A49_20549 [Nicotiana attenuata]